MSRVGWKSTKGMYLGPLSTWIGCLNEVTTNQYVYPSSPFAQGDDVKLKVDPADPNIVMIFGKA